VEVQPAAEPAPIVAKPAPSPSRPEAAPPAGSWAVQVGSFSSADNAKRLRSELNAAGYATFQVQLVANDKTMHRVRVGPVKDRAAADALAARLGKAGYPGRVVQVDE
ncbi:MAG: SPOR domain-containing protein, partial [Gammaproteobacteria bacterium]